MMQMQIHCLRNKVYIISTIFFRWFLASFLFLWYTVSKRLKLWFFYNYKLIKFFIPCKIFMEILIKCWKFKRKMYLFFIEMVFSSLDWRFDPLFFLSLSPHKKRIYLIWKKWNNLRRWKNFKKKKNLFNYSNIYVVRCTLRSQKCWVCNVMQMMWTVPSLGRKVLS